MMNTTKNVMTMGMDEFKEFAKFFVDTFANAFGLSYIDACEILCNSVLVKENNYYGIRPEIAERLRMYIHLTPCVR